MPKYKSMSFSFAQQKRQSITMSDVYTVYNVYNVCDQQPRNNI